MSQQYQQEQLECLPSEIPPAAPWLPILVIHIRSQVKTRQSQSYIFKKLPKIKILQFCKNLYTRHTFWGCLIRCMNMKGIQPEPWALQSWHGMQDGMRDGRTDGVKPIYPPTTSLCRGYNNEHGELTLSDILPFSGIILCMRPAKWANDRRRYIVTSSLIGWAHTQNDPWFCLCRFQCVNTLRPRQNGPWFFRQYQMLFLEWECINFD